MAVGDDLGGSISRLAERPRNLALEILVAPPRQFLGIVENLADDFASCLWVAPQLLAHLLGLGPLQPRRA
jgi:hypothetical protein